MKAFWWNANPPNFGDEISPVILDAFVQERIEWVPRETEGKMLAIGSILHCMRRGDMVWGTGYNRKTPLLAPQGVRFLSVRGSITRNLVQGAEVPEVYGDPGLLLPLVYHPKVKKTHRLGYVPHYVDKEMVGALELKADEKLIDIQSGWQNVVKEILSCEKIVASAMHGMICAEAYGIPVTWWRYGDRIQNQEMKGNDYFLGTGRGELPFFQELPPIPGLPKIQQRILTALRNR